MLKGLSSCKGARVAPMCPIMTHVQPIARGRHHLLPQAYREDRATGERVYTSNTPAEPDLSRLESEADFDAQEQTRVAIQQLQVG